MFGKRRFFAPGTFIPTRTRIVVIAQLSLAFSLVSWCILQPFMGAHYTNKSALLLHQTVIGDGTTLTEADSAAIEKLSRNKEHFAKLPSSERNKVNRSYRALQQQRSISFWSKCKVALRIVVFELPTFMQAWIVFSVIITLMLLLRIEGAAMAAWILPLLTMLYAIDNQRHASGPVASPDAVLFPSEQLLTSKYLDDEFSSDIWQQRDQLLKAWKRYLVIEWAKEEPSSLSDEYSRQVEDGEYKFSLARLHTFTSKGPDEEYHFIPQRRPAALLALYLLWNTFFAAYVNRRHALE